MLSNKVKLVVWDLDETFWRGTLSEGGIVPVERNRDIVLELSRRGILNSICSKNTYGDVKAILEQWGIWEHFVYPHIEYSPKGKAIARMLENMGLRAENALLIDDNPTNLEEVKFFNPGIMAAHPSDVLDGLLEHPSCAGKPDTALTRLKQYRFLQRKTEERGASDLSNEEFLRASNIRVEIDYDMEANFDRILDLINRTNQLNFTKVRLNAREAIERFRQNLSTFRSHAGCVRLRDNYGDYGVIGFFQMKRSSKVRKLIHFVFSCRALNMGVEQYVYRLLKRPYLEVVGPVSSDLDSDTGVEWINASSADATAVIGATRGKLVLLGGCDLLQLASYCSSDRIEFVNRAGEEGTVRYDDPCFVLGDRLAIRNCASLQRLSSWTYEDAVRFDEALAASDLVLVSLWPGMGGDFYRTDRGVRIRLSENRADRIRERNQRWFERHFRKLPLSTEERLRWISSSFTAIGAKSPKHSQIVVLGCCTHGAFNDGILRRRNLYNAEARTYCSTRGRFHYVDVDALVSPESMVDKVHFTRQTYFSLAGHILTSISEAANRPPMHASAANGRPALSDQPCLPTSAI